MAIYLVLIVGLIGYWALTNSRRKKMAVAKQQAIQTGTHVMTTFGLYGTVRGVDDDSVLLEIDDNVLVRINKRAVGTVVPDPTDELRASDAETDADELEDVGEDDLDLADGAGDRSDVALDSDADDADDADDTDRAHEAHDAHDAHDAGTAGAESSTSDGSGGHDDGPGPVPAR